MEKLFISFIMGAFGMGYIVYGKRQSNIISLFSGVALCALPYFLSNIYGLICVGIVMLVLPFWIRV